MLATPVPWRAFFAALAGATARGFLRWSASTDTHARPQADQPRAALAQSAAGVRRGGFQPAPRVRDAHTDPVRPPGPNLRPFALLRAPAQPTQSKPPQPLARHLTS